MEKKGTSRQKRRPKGDPNPQKGPLGDPGTLKGTQLGTVVMSRAKEEAILVIQGVFSADGYRLFGMESVTRRLRV